MSNKHKTMYKAKQKILINLLHLNFVKHGSK